MVLLQVQFNYVLKCVLKYNSSAEYANVYNNLEKHTHVRHCNELTIESY